MKLTTAALALSLVLLAGPVAATTFVMVSDADLADQAAVVVEARVLSVDDAPGNGMPSTDYLIEIDRVLKGGPPGSNLIVRVPGGVGPDGMGLKIWGAPEFRVGERPLLFLLPGDDGTYRVLHLMLGAFREVVVAGRPLLVRDLAEAREVALPGEPPDARGRYRQPRDRRLFTAWLADRFAGERRSEDYFAAVAPASLSPGGDAFKLFTHGGRKMRWFHFDDSPGTPVRWRVHNAGQPPFTVEQTIDAFRVALRAWNDDPATNVNYSYAGTTTATGGLDPGGFDNINAIVFGDPNGNPKFDGQFNCASGGVLAIGGPWFDDAEIRTYKGEEYHPIAGGDIVTNKNIECFFTRSGNRTRAAEELFAHELGHTLGLDHSEFGQALMAPTIHDDGRGASLHPDDRAGLASLYGVGSAPAAPSNLRAAVTSETAVQLTWNDNSSDETSFRVERRNPGTTSFTLHQTLAANTRQADVTGLAPGATYGFRVRAANAIGMSAPSNVVDVLTRAPLPAAPAGLTAASSSSTSIELAWSDLSEGETGFVIERRSPLSDYQVHEITGPDVTRFTLTSLTPGLPNTFRVRARNDAGDSEPSNEASATPVTGLPSTCAPAADTLCLLDGRFQVRVQWRNQHAAGGHGVGGAEPFPGSVKTGTFWFFNPDNIELIVKALDGGLVNGRFWLFYGALSDVEYWVTVVDTATGAAKTYHNRPGDLCGVPDTDAFPGAPPAAGSAAVSASPAAASLKTAPAAAHGPCQPDALTLCLLDGRFEVRVAWTDQRTLSSGVGTAVPGTEKSGYFWFFNPQNIELVVKALDARTIDGSFWLFYGALSEVEYTITVRDTVTDITKFYPNEPGNFCGLADTVGFPESL